MLNTLEIGWFLRERCGTANCHGRVDEAVNELESFLTAYEYGYRLLAPGNDEDSVKGELDVLDGLMEGFTFFFGERPETLTPISRTQLMVSSGRALRQHYAIMRHGSFAERAVDHPRLKALRKRLGRTPVAYDGQRRNLTLERAIRTCFNTSGLTARLKENLGAAFAKLVENEYVTIWHARLGLTVFEEAAVVEPVRKLALALKRTAPFGAIEIPRWQASYLVE